jgi:ankyrin repeat protein
VVQDIHANNNAALRRSSSHGKLEVVKYLVENGADIHVNNNEVLYTSSSNGYLKVSEYLHTIALKFLITKKKNDFKFNF